MAVTISMNTQYGESEYTIADKVRDLPANQGLNDHDMWLKIDAEVAAVSSAGHLTQREGRYDSAVNEANNKHGRK